jgi:hypothetical protein
MILHLEYRHRRRSSPSKLWTQALLLAWLSVLLAAAVRDCAAQVATNNAPPATGSGVPAPLTGKERWKFYVDETFASPQPYVVALGAGLAFQAIGYPREWG